MSIRVTEEMCGEVYYMCERLRNTEVQGQGASKVSDIRVSKPPGTMGREITKHKDIYRWMREGFIYSIRNSIKLATVISRRQTIEEENIVDRV